MQNRTPVHALNVNDPKDMDLLNERCMLLRQSLGLLPDEMCLTFEQAAEYLGVSPRTALRYAYQQQPALEIAIDATGKRIKGRLMLDSVVERRIWLERRWSQNPAKR